MANTNTKVDLEISQSQIQDKRHNPCSCLSVSSIRDGSTDLACPRLICTRNEAEPTVANDKSAKLHRIGARPSMCASRHSLIENLESAMMPLTCSACKKGRTVMERLPKGKRQDSLAFPVCFLHLLLIVLPFLLLLFDLS
jgi:hypothetical protein